MEVVGAVSGTLTIINALVQGLEKSIHALRRVQRAPREFEELILRLRHFHALLRAAARIADSVDIDGVPDAVVRVEQCVGKLRRLSQLVLKRTRNEWVLNKLAWARRASVIAKVVEDVEQACSDLINLLTLSTSMTVSGIIDDVQRLRREVHFGLQGWMESKVAVECATNPTKAFLSCIGTACDTSEQTLTRAVSAGMISMATKQEETELNVDEKICRCQCHRRYNIASPLSLSCLGTWACSWTNILWPSSECGSDCCTIHQRSSFFLQYRLPAWFANNIFVFWTRSSTVGRVERVLRVVNVAWSRSYQLALTGNLPALRDLYNSGAAGLNDVNPIDGSTALMAAVRGCQLAVVSFLLANGADCTIQDVGGFDAARCALIRVQHARRRLRIIGMDSQTVQMKEDLSQTFDIDNVLLEGRFTPVHGAVFDQSVDSVNLELQHQPELASLGCVQTQTPLHWAVWLGDVDIVRSLFAHAADPFVIDSWGRSILHFMPFCQSRDVLSELANVMTCRYSHVKWQTALAKRNKAGSTPWQVALIQSNAQSLAFFMKCQPALTMKTTLGRTVYHLAAMHASMDIFDALATADLAEIDVDAKDRFGFTAADYATARLEGRLYLASDVVEQSLCNEREAEELRHLIAYTTTRSCSPTSSLKLEVLFESENWLRHLD